MFASQRNLYSDDMALAREGVSFFKKRKYREAAVILEKALSQKNSSEVLIYLIASYLLTDNFILAEGMISQLKRNYPSHPCGAQFDGFIYLKSAYGADAAVIKYIELARKFPENFKIRKILKKLERVENFKKFQKKTVLYDCVDLPALPFPKRSPFSFLFFRKKRRVELVGVGAFRFKKIVVLSIAVMLVVIIFVFCYPYAKSFVAERIIKNTYGEKDAELDYGSLDDVRYSLIDKNLKDKPLVYFDDDDSLKKEYASARSDIKKGAYNSALFSLNRILCSNANMRVKDKALYLHKFVTNIEDRPSTEIPFSRISATPFFYTGSSVRWSGRAANVKVRKDKTSFTLIVDYKDDETFSGIAEVFFDGLVNIEKGKVTTVEGVFVNAIGKEGRLYVDALKIY